MSKLIIVTWAAAAVGMAGSVGYVGSAEAAGPGAASVRPVPHEPEDSPEPGQTRPEDQPGQAGQPATDEVKKQLMAMLAVTSGRAPEHDRLNALEGRFEVETTMMFPGMMAPIVARSTAVNEWVLGRRFLRSTTIPAAGEALTVETLSYFGFDKRHKAYFWTGMDSTDTYAVYAQGPADAATGVMTLWGENMEPTGAMKFKAVVDAAAEGRPSMEIWFQMNPEAGDAGWVRIVRTVYTRM